MKSLIALSILCLLATPILLTAQTTVLFEDFEDQNLFEHPAWFGDTQDFSFYYDSLEQNRLLRLDAAPDPTRTQIVTESNTTAGSWQLYIRQDFTPSNFNRAFVFLMADQPDLNYLDGSSVSGYALRTGDNESPRKFRLIRFDGGNQTELLESDTIIEEGTGYTIRVERSAAGEWRLSIAEGQTSLLATQSRSIVDATYTRSSYMGLLMRYSSGNVQNFFFDDIQVENSEPFKIMDAAVVSASQIAITFNYPIDESDLTEAAFNVSGLGNPERVSMGAANTRVLLTYSQIITDGTYSLRIENLENIYGGRLDPVPGGEFDFSFQNPFTLLSAEVASPRSIVLNFSLPPDPGILKSRFRINQNIIPDQLQADSTRIVLLFNNPLPAGEVTISVSSLRSVGGWILREGTSVTTFLFDDAFAGDIAINEILYRRASSSAPQFIELFNNSGGIYDLSGWMIETDRGEAEIPAGTVLQPGEYILFFDEPGQIGPDSNTILLNDFVPLRTTGDRVVVRNRELVAVDSVEYSPDWGGNDPGISLERKDPEAISIDPANWGTNISAEGSSPLSRNSVYGSDQRPPELLFAGYEPTTRLIRLRFNEFVDRSTARDVSINGVPARLFDSQSGLLAGNELMVEANTIDLARNTVLELEGLSDYQGNASGEVSQPVAMPVKEGDLVFNEIMYDPLDDAFDELPNQSDYIELANRRPYAISLEGIYLQDAPNENGEARKTTPVDSRSKWIPARGFALFYPETETIDPELSRTGRFFNLDQHIKSHALRIERNTLSLPKSGREITLADSSGAIIDRVHYLPGWHNPNLIDTKGVSLERVSPTLATSGADNWGSNALPEGGTPGAENSLFQPSQMAANSQNIAVEPNPFSPDGDGHEDHLMIRYSFDQPDFMLRVRIFDRHGRLVRTLTDSHPAGYDGSLIWNGFTDGGVTGRIGIYIIHTEAYNASTGEEKEFKTVAVLARQF